MDEDKNELLVDKLDRWRLWAEEVIDEAFPNNDMPSDLRNQFLYLSGFDRALQTVGRNSMAAGHIVSNVIVKIIPFEKRSLAERYLSVLDPEAFFWTVSEKQEATTLRTTVLGFRVPKNAIADWRADGFEVYNEDRTYFETGFYHGIHSHVTECHALLAEAGEISDTNYVL